LEFTKSRARGRDINNYRSIGFAAASAILLCLSTATAFATDPIRSDRGETPDDPPGAPAATILGGPRGNGPVTLGPFTAVQVNVDAMGNNVVGDAANEPSIAIDPTDPQRIAIGWRQFDTTASNFRQAGVAYSQDGGLTWTFPGVLDPGQFRSDPVLSSDADGNFYYSSLSSVTSADMFKSVDGGVTWSAPVPAFGGDKQWIAVDRTDGIGRGNIYQFWNTQFSCCNGNDFTRSTDGGASFEVPLRLPVPSMKWGTLDVGPDGALVMVGSTLNQMSHLFVKSSNALDALQTPDFGMSSQSIDLGGRTRFQQVPNPAGLLGQTQILTDHAPGPSHGNLYVLASVDPGLPIDRLDVMFIRSTDGGGTWTAPIRVNDDPQMMTSVQWFGTMAVAPNGRIDVIWNDTRNSPSLTFSEVFYTFSIDAGDTWATSIPVTPPYDHSLGYPNQNKLGDYYHMLSDENAANLAFAATFNGEQDVYFMRIVADCNENGTHDANDIRSGASLDCNGNVQPDECEPDWDSIPTFVLALLKPDEVGNDLCLFDVNADGIIDGLDIRPFIAERLLTGP
jgi:hypothetical protein